MKLRVPFPKTMHFVVADFSPCSARPPGLGEGLRSVSRTRPLGTTSRFSREPSRSRLHLCMACPRGSRGRQHHPATSPHLRQTWSAYGRLKDTSWTVASQCARDASKWSSTCNTEILSNISANSDPSNPCLTAVRRYDTDHWRKLRHPAPELLGHT